jgi:hypothetical protein
MSQNATHDPETTGAASNGDGQAKTSSSAAANEFRQAAEEPKEGLVAEFVDFLRNNKKWWLTPIIVILLLFGLLIILAGTGAAPFIYTLF